MKIPKKLKGTDVIAIGQYAIYTSSLLKAAAVAGRLHRKDIKSGIPCMGKITLKGKTYWWCRYGFLNDSDIYTK